MRGGLWPLHPGPVRCRSRVLLWASAVQQVVKLRLEGEVGEIGHAVEIKHAVEMVHLMLHHTGVEARSLALDPPSVGRKTMVEEEVVPRNQAAQHGYRETSLKSEADAAAQGLDHQVDQGGRRFRDL